MNKKGQSAIESLLNAPILLIILLVSVVMLFPVIDSLNDSLDTANADQVSNVTFIRVLIGLIPFIVTALVIVVIARSFGRRQQPPSAQGFA